MTELLSLQSLTVGYPLARKQSKRVVGPLTLQIRPGELVCLVGPNGCGKSTLLKTIAGLLPPVEGSVLLQGESLSSLSLLQRAQRMALVLTRFAGVHGMTAFDSVALGRTPHANWIHKISTNDRNLILQAMQETDTMHLENRGIDALSDGERQRLAVARALAQEARMILLDEPTAFLDLPHRVGLMGLLRTLCRKQQVGVFMSTHDLDLALRFADQVLVIDAQGGHAYGIPESLALEGVFDRVFSTPQVSFDLASGSFRLEEDSCAPASCSDPGLVGSWTRRALRRQGWRIEEGSFPAISIREEEGRTTWILQLGPRDEREFLNLEALLETLRQSKAQP